MDGNLTTSTSDRKRNGEYLLAAEGGRYTTVIIKTYCPCCSYETKIKSVKANKIEYLKYYKRETCTNETCKWTQIL